MGYYLNVYENPETFYEEIELFSAGSQQLKLDEIRIIQQICNWSLDEILFIDDRKDVEELMNSNSINAILITDLTNNGGDY